ncbi:B3/B4 domain-containing protein [Oceanisphaera psychrotolerans]|uniref:B3/B4 tRNA-binding domain-containing protein n=1 Tax=Oceanisphaera psychrotolerans TaxID=1414654 RepID=A0A1J4QIQ4_9GAMM|nr:phenylalanine--tRNA ligase beta subunit-related protein [Oceanisphaera psychrotolerans]OIN12382.1 hypothetical protein BFR47_01470 [Oceanisphaera psychrotolerans]
MTSIFRLATPSQWGIKALAFTCHDLDNQRLDDALQQQLSSLRAQFDAQHALAMQQGFIELRQQVGRSIKRFPPSPLALYQQFERKGQLQAISPLVDLYNQWSLNSGLSIGAHDLQQLQLPVRLDMSRGGEEFMALGSAQARPLPAGEYGYFDGGDQVLCRMEYRQAAATALQAHTRAALFIVQGHAQTSDSYLQDIAAGLKQDLQRYCQRRKIA